MRHHSPTIRLGNARRARDLAEQACPHWDYESGPEGDHECCRDLREAQHELRLAREAVRKAKGNP